MELFKLFGTVLVDNKKANESIHKTESKASKLANTMTKGIGTAAKWGAGILAGATAAAGGLFAIATKGAEATDRIDKMSQKIGISKKAFQEYDYILSQNGADVEKLQVGFKTLTQRMDESVKGLGKGAEAFDKLEVSAQNVDGTLKSQEQMFEEVAKKMMQMPEGAEKSQLAFDLFGKAGLELMPMLNSTADNFDDLKQKAHDMGLVLSDESIDAGVKFTDTLDNVKRSLGSVMTQIGVKVMPIIQELLDWVLEHMPEIQEVIGVVFEKIGEFVNVAIEIFKEHLLPIFQAIYDWTKENWPAIQEIIDGVFEAIKKVWEDVLKPVFDLLSEIIMKVVQVVKDNWPTISSIFETVFAAIETVWNEVLKPVFDFLLEAVGAVVDFIADNFPDMLSTVESIFDGIGIAIDAVVEIFKTLVGWIKDAWEWLTTWNDTPVDTKDMGPGYNKMYDSGYYDRENAKKDKNKYRNKNKHKKRGRGRGQIEGSFAYGLSYVPFDGFIAELHKGERVLTAQENKKYKQAEGSVTNNFNISSLVVREEADIKKIAIELEKRQKQSKRGRGYVWT